MLRALLCLRSAATGHVLRLNDVYAPVVMPPGSDDDADDIDARARPLPFACVRAPDVALALLALPAPYGLDVNAADAAAADGRDEAALHKAVRHAMRLSDDMPTAPVADRVVDALLLRASDAVLNARVPYRPDDLAGSELDDCGDPHPHTVSAAASAADAHRLPLLHLLVLESIPAAPYDFCNGVSGAAYVERLCDAKVARDDGSGYDLFARWTRPPGPHSSATPRTARELAAHYLDTDYPLGDDGKAGLQDMHDTIAAAEQRVIAYARGFRAAVLGLLNAGAATAGSASVSARPIPAPVLDIVFAYALRHPHLPVVK